MNRRERTVVWQPSAPESCRAFGRTAGRSDSSSSRPHLLMGRIIAIDYGTRRTGIAVSRPPATHRRGARHGRNTRVGALPDTIYRTGGRFGHRRGQAFEDERCPVGNDALRAAARGAVAAVPTPRSRSSSTDERFTSAIAHRAMLDGGLRKMARRNRALVDKISATIILEDFMSSRRAEQHR